MRNRISALAAGCLLALAACSGGGNSSPAGVTPAGPNSPATSAPGSSSGSNAGKAAVSVTFNIPAKGTPASTLRKSPQYISANTTQVTITFNPSGGGTYLQVSNACSGPGPCTLQAFVTPGTYNVLATAGDGNGPLSAGTQTGFTVTLGAANTLTIAALTEVLNYIHLNPAFPAVLYDGQTSTPALTALSVDVDGIQMANPPPWVDVNGTPITGMQVVPTSPSGTLTLNGGIAPVPITSSSQVLAVSYNGTEALNPASVGAYAQVSTGNPGLGSVTSEIYSPFDVTQTAPVAFNPLTGANTGNPAITNQDYYGQANIEYPLFINQAQTITLTDQNGVTNGPTYVDPSVCTDDSPYPITNFVAGGTPYVVGSPIPITSYPATITYTIQPTTSGNCYLQINDSANNYYYVELYFNENALYVTGKKRGKAK